MYSQIRPPQRVVPREPTRTKKSLTKIVGLIPKGIVFKKLSYRPGAKRLLRVRRREKRARESKTELSTSIPISFKGQNEDECAEIPPPETNESIMTGTLSDLPDWSTRCFPSSRPISPCPFISGRRSVSRSTDSPPKATEIAGEW